MSVTVVVGGQAGSEGKGAVCDYLHSRYLDGDDVAVRYTAAVRVGGPNAGHTVVDGDGRAWALQQVPVAAVSDPECQLYIAAGSEVCWDTLDREVEGLERAGFDVRSRLTIDGQATVVDAEARAAEADIQTGTTGKGIGGARARRAMRQAPLVESSDRGTEYHVAETQGPLRASAMGGELLIEGTQGYVLGSHAGYYPFSTSGDCRASDFMAWCGLAPMAAKVWVVLRMNPIRIAGNSGPLPGETSWGELGQAPELTTVTKKVRRVANWNWQWPERSIAANRGPGGVGIALTFVDYPYPELAGVGGRVRESDLPKGLQGFLQTFRDRLNLNVDLLGTGPRTVIEVGA